jgi:hypothetical protein
MSNLATIRWVRPVALAGLIVFFTGVGAASATPVTTNLVLELRSDTGVTQTSGLVSAWADQSGQGNHVSQSGVDTLKPQLITGVTNGLQTFDVLRFDGVDDVLSRVSPDTANNLATNTSGGTIFMVYRTSQATVNQVALAYGVNDSNRVSFGMANGVNWNTRVRIGGASAAGSTSGVTSAEAGGGGAPLLDTFYAQAAVWDGTTSGGLVSKLLLSNGSIITGTDTGTAAAGAFAPTALHVGRYVFASGTGLNFQGDIAEILIYNDNLSLADQASVFNFLGAKYGIVPEPASIFPGILGVAGVAVLVIRRRR